MGLPGRSGGKGWKGGKTQAGHGKGGHGKSSHGKGGHAQWHSHGKGSRGKDSHGKAGPAQWHSHGGKAHGAESHGSRRHSHRDGGHSHGHVAQRHSHGGRSHGGNGPKGHGHRGRNPSAEKGGATGKGPAKAHSRKGASTSTHRATPAGNGMRHGNASNSAGRGIESGGAVTMHRSISGIHSTAKKHSKRSMMRESTAKPGTAAWGRSHHEGCSHFGGRNHATGKPKSSESWTGGSKGRGSRKKRAKAHHLLATTSGQSSNPSHGGARWTIQKLHSRPRNCANPNIAQVVQTSGGGAVATNVSKMVRHVAKKMHLSRFAMASHRKMLTLSGNQFRPLQNVKAVKKKAKRSSQSKTRPHASSLKHRIVTPSEVRYSQASISNTFQDGNSLQDTKQAIASGKLPKRGIRPIRVYKTRKGNLISHDNRRLAIFKELEAEGRIDKIKVQVTKQRVPSWKFSSLTRGLAVKLRQKCQQASGSGNSADSGGIPKSIA